MRVGRENVFELWFFFVIDCREEVNFFLFDRLFFSRIRRTAFFCVGKLGFFFCMRFALELIESTDEWV